MTRKIGFAILAASLLCLAAPVYAETFTTADGVFSIDLPNENWKEIQDPSKWVTISDGANLLTVDHYSNGEDLPDMAVADDHFINVYQAVYSTQNEVFIITGSVVDNAVIPDLVNSILSAKVLKFNTKMAVKKEDDKNQQGTNGFTVEAMSATVYASTDVNVRQSYSTDSEVIGGISKDTAVTVTGKVLKDGSDYGWYQISFNSGTGYVSAQFMTDKAPEKPASSDKPLTGSVKQIYQSDGTGITIYESTDGNWYDKAGNAYVRTTDYEFVSSDGSKTYSTNQPQTASGNTPAGNPFTVYWANGNTDTLTYYSDGFYYSSSWVRYWPEPSNGSYIGDDGTILYSSPEGPNTPRQNIYADQENADQETAPQDRYIANEQEQHMLVSRDNGSEVLVSAGGGAYYDEAGTEYSWIDDGGMMDYFGNRYDVRW